MLFDSRDVYSTRDKFDVGKTRQKFHVKLKQNLELKRWNDNDLTKFPNT